jgi:hypothetical protein
MRWARRGGLGRFGGAPGVFISAHSIPNGAPWLRPELSNDHHRASGDSPDGGVRSCASVRMQRTVELASLRRAAGSVIVCARGRANARPFALRARVRRRMNRRAGASKGRPHSCTGTARRCSRVCERLCEIRMLGRCVLSDVQVSSDGGALDATVTSEATVLSSSIGAGLKREEPNKTLHTYSLKQQL